MPNTHIVLIVEGISEIGALVWSEIGNLICSRHLNGTRVALNFKFILGKSHLPSTSSELLF